MDYVAGQCCSAILTTIQVTKTIPLDENAWVLEQLAVVSSTMLVVKQTTTHCHCNNLVMTSGFFLNVGQTMKDCPTNNADCPTQTTL